MYNFSDLHWLRVKNVRRRNRGKLATVISATCGQEPSHCPKCGDRRSLRNHGKKITTFRDLPQSDGRFVAIEVDRLRYRCASCGMTSLQAVADMDDKYRMTERLVERIRLEAAQRPFTAVAADFGMHEKTVRRIVRDRIPFLTRRTRIAGEQSGSGLDGQSLGQLVLPADVGTLETIDSDRASDGATSHASGTRTG